MVVSSTLAANCVCGSIYLPLSHSIGGKRQVLSMQKPQCVSVLSNTRSFTQAVVGLGMEGVRKDFEGTL